MRIQLLCLYLPCFTTLYGTDDWADLSSKLSHADYKEKLIPLSGGASNSNFSMIYQGEKIFIRIENPDAGGSSEVDYQTLKILEPLNIAPKTHYFDKKKRILISEFINHIQDFDNQTVLKSVKILHETNLVFSEYYNPFEGLRELFQKANKGSIKPPRQFEKILLPFITKVEENYPITDKLVPCHLDLHRGNFLHTDKQLYIIDWEYAAMSDPIYDLATWASNEQMSDKEMEEILSNYGSLEEWERLINYRIIASTRWALWAFLLHQKGYTKENYEAIFQYFITDAIYRTKKNIGINRYITV